jgi:hypothetical protein
MFTDPPQVTLQLGNKLNPDTIKENDDVYFECNIRANPKKYKITWLHNVSIPEKYLGMWERNDAILFCSSKRRREGSGEDYITRNLMTCTQHQISFG